MHQEYDKFIYHDNGANFYLRFRGYKGDVPQCKIESVDSENYADTKLNSNVRVVQHYGESIMFEPMHVDFF